MAKFNNEFFIPLKKIPTVTHQEKKIHVVKGKPIFYEDDRLKDARAKLMSGLYPFAPDVPLDGPIEVIVKWLFPDYSSNHPHGSWKTTKPDTHNMNKLLFDVMTDLGFWKDDRLVVREIIEKFWVDPKQSPSGIYIAIQKLE